MGSILEATLIHHVCIVLVLLWLLNSFNCCHPFAYFLSLIYLYLVHDLYETRLRRKLQFEERRQSDQKRVLSDSETVRWLNHAIEKIWLVCVEEIVSQKILLPIFPWFLQKYKPWTVKDAVVQHLYLGRSPPIFTEMRVLPESNGDDHLVLELGMNFLTADDMSAIIAVKLTKRLGLGMRAKMHLLGMHVEGKVLIGVKFLPHWPFLGRLRICFAEPPYFQMTVKPIFSHGLDVTELPGIAGWIDNLLALVFEQTLVQPNMLVVDVEKFASPQPENWFSIDAKEPIAYAIVEVLEAADMKPSDLNGLADPYVKGQLGPYRFRTKIQKKNLSPKWYEPFKIPICSWESPNVLNIEVRDKDRLFDDLLGNCSVNINDFKGGQRRDMWLSLENIKMGRLHLAVTVSKGNTKGAENTRDAEGFDNEQKRNSVAADAAQRGPSFKSSEKSLKVADKFEPIDIEGQRETGIWIHQPGSEVAQVWEPRKGKSTHLETYHLDGQAQAEGGDPIGSRGSTSSSADESVDAKKPRSTNPIRKGLRKLSSVFHRSPRTEEKSKCLVEPESASSYANIKALNDKEIGVKLIVDDTIATPYSAKAPKDDEKENRERSEQESPQQGHAKDMAKGILKHPGKSLKYALTRKERRKSRTDSGSTPSDNDTASQCDSSDESTLPSSTDVPLGVTNLVIPGSVVSIAESRSGNNSFKTKDNMNPTEAPLGVTNLVIPGSVVSSAESRSGNNSFKTKDNMNPTEALSGTNSFKDDIIQTRNEAAEYGTEQKTKVIPEDSETIN
ncbi:C2 domain-containing protein [Forsythia ovata]|uniref:C2 domain-containing protein n=1 Tax=Forsythia ovata TaxID=205694 RepID=A0ABD1R4X2_9LAMI